MPGGKRAGKLAVLLMPYFGRWPEWVAIYLESCRWNAALDFLLVSDCGPPPVALPDNVSLLEATLAALNDRYVERFPGRRPVQHPYKLCDLRPAFGRIFAEHIAGYEYFGWGDIDVVYGDVVGHLTAEMLAADVISFNKDHVSGHLTLARTACADELPEAFPGWFEEVDADKYRHLDEPRGLRRLALSAVESFNTPLSPLIPWTDGRFVFPREWYWKSGELTNDLDGPRTFAYLHFMHWKGGDWPRQCGNAQWEALERVMHLSDEDVARGFRLSALGVFPLDGRERGGP